MTYIYCLSQLLRLITINGKALVVIVVVNGLLLALGQDCVSWHLLLHVSAAFNANYHSKPVYIIMSGLFWGKIKKTLDDWFVKEDVTVLKI